jgi:hypothetical protein
VLKPKQLCIVETLEEYYKTPDDFIAKDIDEKAAIQLLIRSFEGREGRHSDLNIFSNLLYGEAYLKNWAKYTGCYCLTNFLVKDVGLHIQGKPGEIDILLLPFDRYKVYYEKCSVFEVKIAKPHSENITKGANSDGYSQAIGLVKAGFPYVRLIHIIASQPLPNEQKPEIKFMKRPANIEEQPGRILPGIDEFELVKWDWLPFYGRDIQMKRLLSYDIPKYVGLKVITMNFYADGSYGLGFSMDWQDFEMGYLNPHRKRGTVDLIKLHHSQFSLRYKKIEFRFPGSCPDGPTQKE